MFDMGDVIAACIGSFITAVLGYFGVVRKNKTDEAEVVLTAWKELLAPLQIELSAAKIEIANLRSQLEKTEARHRREQDRLMRKIKELQTSMKVTNQRITDET